MLECSLAREDLKKYLSNQCDYFFPDKYKFAGNDVEQAIDVALERVEFCFKHIIVHGYIKNNMSYFYHLHSDQYSTFLYYLSNSLWNISENKPLCDKLILLNRTLHGLWFSYKTKLPDVFLLVHPMGSVLGNALYSDFLVVVQNVTVNTPVVEGMLSIGKGVFLSAGSTIIGNKKIGDRVSIGVDVCIHNKEVESDSVVFRDDKGALCVKKKVLPMAQRYFNVKL